MVPCLAVSVKVLPNQRSGIETRREFSKEVQVSFVEP